MTDWLEAFKKATGNKKPGVIEMLKYLDSRLCENSKMVDFEQMGDPQEARRVLKEILEAGRIPAKDCFMGSGALVVNKKKGLQTMVQKILNDNLSGNYDPKSNSREQQRNEEGLLIDEALESMGMKNPVKVYDPKSNRREQEGDFWKKTYNHLFPDSPLPGDKPKPAPIYLSPQQAVAVLESRNSQRQYASPEVRDSAILDKDRITSELINIYGDEEFIQRTGGIASYMKVAAEVQKRTNKRLNLPDLNNAVDELVSNGMMNPVITLDSGYKILMLKSLPLEKDHLRILDIARTSRTLTSEGAASSLGWNKDRASSELEYLHYLGIAQKTESLQKQAYLFPGL